jgi:hypothetical protein
MYFLSNVLQLESNHQTCYIFLYILNEINTYVESVDGKNEKNTKQNSWRKKQKNQHPIYPDNSYRNNKVL